MQIRSVGIDLGKTTFHLVALGDSTQTGADRVGSPLHGQDYRAVQDPVSA
jgi:hypothetical protein